MSEVFISHPGLQHSHQLAWALWEYDLLQAFWSGVPVLSKGEELAFLYPKVLAQKLKKVPIPKKFCRHPIIFPVLLKVGNQLPIFLKGDDLLHKLCHWYDWWISGKIKKIQPRVVVAYENSAYHTFRAAKSIGARCILDAASFHYAVGKKLGVEQVSSYSAEVYRRKELEIDLADLILTCSPMAAKSYLEAGVKGEKLKPVMLGADLPIIPYHHKPHNRPLRFIFAGALSYRKSIDVILTAFRRLYDEGFQTEVLFVGGIGEPIWLEEIRKLPNASYHSGVTQTELFKMMATADSLLLPSRFDSFGMVVAEAMACGTPAIVSSMTGAKAMIEQFPGSGWIVEPTVDSLYQCVRHLVENRAELFAARDCAQEAARHFTWQAYRQRVGQVIQEFIDHDGR